MTTPYREDPSAELEAFANHVAAGESLLVANLELQQQLAIMPRARPDIHQGYLNTWGDLWAQLDQARAILVRVRRDTTAFDAARERAGNPRLVVGRFTPLSEPMRIATREAIAALRAAVPGVPIPKLPPAMPVKIDAAAFTLHRRSRLSPRFWYLLVRFGPPLVVLLALWLYACGK